MNRKVFNTVLLFTATVLVAIILLQLFWLNNLVEIRRQELTSHTQEAITRTVERLEKDESIHLVMHNLDTFFPDSFLLKPANTIKVMVNSNDSIETIDVSNEPMDGEGSVDRRQIITSKHSNQYITRESRITWTADNADRKNRKLLEIDSVVQQMIVEMDTRGVSVRIQPDTLYRMLKAELFNRGIRSDFEFAIFQGDSTIHTSPNYIPSSAALTFEGKLFPNDIWDKNLKLVMYYPMRESGKYIFAKMSSSLMLTGLLTLAILFAFYYTIRTIKKQKRLGEMKDDFINNITHEFKTPIATSAIAISALESNQVRNNHDKFSYYTGILKEENKKMNEHVERVLQLAMMENGLLKLNPIATDIHKLLSDSIHGLELLASEKQIQIHTGLHPSTFTCLVDPFHFKNVLNNIIDNAIKYNHHGGKVEVETKINSNMLYIIIADNGIGMNKLTLSNAFQSFYRGQSGNIHDVKGFGLGLSYAKNIIEISKGKIDIVSEPGKGTEVTIQIPLI